MDDFITKAMTAGTAQHDAHSQAEGKISYNALNIDDRQIKDPALPDLQTAMSAEAMREILSRHIVGFMKGSAITVSNCEIGQVYYHPGKQCGVTYELMFQPGPTGPSRKEWFFGQMLPKGTGDRRFERAVKRVKKETFLHAFLDAVPPVSRIEDLNMILWMFPHDPKMHTLAKSVDPDYVRCEVEAHASLFLPEAQQGEEWICRELQAQRIKHMPGKRCVMRYRAVLENGDGERHPISFFHKIYNDSNSRYYYHLLDTAYSALTLTEKVVEIPRPLRFIDAQNTFWQVDWGGRSLVDVFQTREIVPLFTRIAEILAGFHQAAVSDLSRGPGFDEILQTAIEDAATLNHYLPKTTRMTSVLLYYLSNARVEWAEATLPQQPIHGACRLEQMLLRDSGEIALVDFDAFALADPLSDLAEFIASLQVLEFTGGVDPAVIRTAVNTLVREYDARTPWECDPRRLAWYVLAFLVSKMYSPIKHYQIEAILQMTQGGMVKIVRRWLRYLKEGAEGEIEP